MDFLEELQERVLIADGAMGTELLAAGAPAGHGLEELCVSQPDLVRGIHDAYIQAGARVIETNSFGANAVRLARHGLEGRVNELNWTAAQLAKDAAKGTGVYVAGSVGPLGITAEEAAARGIDRHGAFLEQIGALLDGGCNLIILETFLDVDEALIALNAKHTLHHCPIVVLLSIDNPNRLSLAIEKLRNADADLVGLNCLEGKTVLSLLAGLSGQDPAALAAYPSAGLPVSSEGQLHYSVSPENFAATGQALADQGVHLIGGCCGVGPAHIAALDKALKASAESR